MNTRFIAESKRRQLSLKAEEGDLRVVCPGFASSAVLFIHFFSQIKSGISALISN
jgi:hypothetical protein